MDATPFALIAVMLVAAAIGSLPVILIAVLLIRGTKNKTKMGINVSPGACPGCATPLPKVRKPANMRQAMWGGWTCSTCGLELDKWGRVLDGDGKVKETPEG